MSANISCLHPPSELYSSFNMTREWEKDELKALYEVWNECSDLPLLGKVCDILLCYVSPNHDFEEMLRI